jgi:cbb3-type cytochrome oxidase subunit 3
MDKFIFWGLFVALGLIVLGYIIWMYWIENKEKRG